MITLKYNEWENNAGVKFWRFAILAKQTVIDILAYLMAGLQ